MKAGDRIELTFVSSGNGKLEPTWCKLVRQDSAGVVERALDPTEKIPLALALATFIGHLFD